MTVDELRNKLRNLPGHWTVSVNIDPGITYLIYPQDVIPVPEDDTCFLIAQVDMEQRVWQMPDPHVRELAECWESAYREGGWQ
jgi:hypothetical protein